MHVLHFSALHRCNVRLTLDAVSDGSGPTLAGLELLMLSFLSSLE
jgi:hypothetical protein